MKTITIIKYNDPGHGWYKVKRSLLTKLGIAGQITTYSYQRKDNVYLEEDCDATILFRALGLQGIICKVKWIQTNKRSKIRGYEYYNTRG